MQTKLGHRFELQTKLRNGRGGFSKKRNENEE